jgi:hypothetical protein
MQEGSAYGNFQEYINRLHVPHEAAPPAAIQIAERLASTQNRPMQAQDLRDAAKIQTPESVGALEQAKVTSKEESEYLTKTFGDFPKTSAAYQSIYDNSNRVSSVVDSVLEKITKNPNAVGVGGLLDLIPETDAKTVRAQLDTLGSNIALDKLTELKSLSPTGASGFGALSEGELHVIQNFIAKLDNKLPPEELAKGLVEVKVILDKAKNAAVQSWKDDSDWMDTYKTQSPMLYARAFPHIKRGRELTNGAFGPAPAPGDPEPAPTTGDSFTKNRETISGPKTYKWGSGR